MTQNNNIMNHVIPLGAACGLILALFLFAVKMGTYVERFETAAVNMVELKRTVKETKKKGDKTAQELSEMKLTFKQDVIEIVEDEFFERNK